MKIATVVLTAPRPTATLQRTLNSLKAAGWADRPGSAPAIGICHDRASSGHFSAYIEALRCAVNRRPEADAFFIVEDDVVFCRGLWSYLQQTLWPGSVEKIALCSPYCPKAYRQRRRGWNDAQSNRGFYLAGSQAWIFPPKAARAILAELAPLQSIHNADWEIGKWADATRRKVWHHTPSLAQHIGLGNSVLGDDSTTDIRLAADFIGENEDAMNNMASPR